MYIVSLAVILSNWVCDDWVYRFPKIAQQFLGWGRSPIFQGRLKPILCLCFPYFGRRTCLEHSEKEGFYQDLSRLQAAILISVFRWVFSVWAFCCHMWALHEPSEHSKLRENHFKDDLKNHFKDDLAFSRKRFRFTKTMREIILIWKFQRNIYPSQKKMWEIMLRLNGPLLLFCADSGAPILKTPKFSANGWAIDLGCCFAILCAIEIA